MTQLISARNHELTPEMESIALKEAISTDELVTN